ncbi:hypothetical protein F5884DRAFT_870190 [Xylogone sp. PMI_703]|nr:hypothetical protein F5884DRAFT_870190 [Xylogone sp. PMI_703]
MDFSRPENLSGHVEIPMNKRRAEPRKHVVKQKRRPAYAQGHVTTVDGENAVELSLAGDVPHAMRSDLRYQAKGLPRPRNEYTTGGAGAVADLSVTSFPFERLQALEIEVNELKMQKGLPLHERRGPTQVAVVSPVMPKATIDLSMAPKVVEGHQYPRTESTEEADTFGVDKGGQKSTSLRSKLSDLHEDLAIGYPSPQSSDSSRRHKEISQEAESISLQLPNYHRLHYLLQIYFTEHNPFLPCINQKNFEERLLRELTGPSYHPASQTLKLNVSETGFAALLCVVLALADFIDPQKVIVQEDSSADSFTLLNQEALLILRNNRYLRLHDLDLIRFHILDSMYLINTERLGEASKAIVMAIDLAITAGLHNQPTWKNCSAEEISTRKMLWWTVYYMDRKIAEQCGRPYFVRDNEINVEDYSSLPRIAPSNLSRLEARNRWELSYLQTNIDWARLWGQIWDKFFAVQAQKLGDIDEVDAMDARIEGAMRRLPQDLRWDINFLDSSAQGNGHRIRGCLLIFTRFNLLRLNLRHNPLNRRYDERTSALCGSLSISTINSIVAYMKRFSHAGQLGYFVIEALVECVYQLIPSLMIRTQEMDRNIAFNALQDTHEALHNLSVRHRAALRAEKALAQVFAEVNRLHREDCIRTDQEIQQEFMQSTILSYPSREFLLPNNYWALASDPVETSAGPVGEDFFNQFGSLPSGLVQNCSAITNVHENC